MNRSPAPSALQKAERAVLRDEGPIMVCVYDNPATMAREAWQNGRLLCKLDATAMLGAGFNGGSWMPFFLNVGQWCEGKLWGNPEAVGK